MPIRAYYYLLLGLWFSALQLYGQREIYDPARELELLQEYVLQSSVLSQHQLNHASQEAKQSSVANVNIMIGGPVAADLQPAAVDSSAPDPAFAAAQANLAREVATNSNLTSYLAWAQQNREATAAMNLQLLSLLRANDQAKLDWAGQLKLAATLKILSNDQIGLKINASNAAAEARMKDRIRTTEYLKRDEESEIRLEAEASLVRP